MAAKLDPAAPFCVVCGAHGCDFAVDHRNAFVTFPRGRRTPRGPIRRWRSRRT